MRSCCGVQEFWPCHILISVHWLKVQSKVNMKYDTWHKEILSKFASRLGDNMQDFYGSVSKVSIKLD